MGADLVAIGTSLGGLRALSRLLAALPVHLPVPIVIVQHRAGARVSDGLTSVLQDATGLPVVEAEDKMALESGTVYVAPADYHLLVEARSLLALSTDPPVRSARPSIDVLFHSAADVYGDRLAGVLLTGASADGAAGLAAIKARGGWAVVEDPATAECPTMPSAGIRATPVDCVLPLPRIGAYLVTLVEGARA